MAEITLQDIMGKNPKACTSAELQAAIEEIEKLAEGAKVQHDRAVRSEARKAAQRKRAQYQLALPLNRTEYAYSGFLKDVSAHFESESVLTAEQFQHILQRNTYCKPNDFGKVYPCPECGNLHLYVARFSSKGSSKDTRQVVCGTCEWECPRKSTTDWDAKDVFVLYLHKQGFLGDKKPKLEDVK